MIGTRSLLRLPFHVSDIPKLIHLKVMKSHMKNFLNILDPAARFQLCIFLRNYSHIIYYWGFFLPRKDTEIQRLL